MNGLFNINVLEQVHYYKPRIFLLPCSWKSCQSCCYRTLLNTFWPNRFENSIVKKNSGLRWLSDISYSHYTVSFCLHKAQRLTKSIQYDGSIFFHRSIQAGGQSNQDHKRLSSILPHSIQHHSESLCVPNTEVGMPNMCWWLTEETNEQGVKLTRM